jgi:hypothetical protein
MAQKFAGAAFQAARLARFLGAIEESSDDHFPVAVQDAISAISALDITLDDGSRAQGWFASGMRSANSLLLSRLKQLAVLCAGNRNTIGDLRSMLSEIRQDHGRLLEVTSAGQRTRP